jgi:predicted Zn-dependent protease
MKRILIFILFLSFAISCRTVPISGRRQVALLPSSQMLSLSQTSYQEFLSTNKSKVASSSSPDAQLVQRVGRNIQQAVEKYMRDNGMQDRLREFSWEFNLVNENTVNAWAMPGGKVVVYAGILPIAKTEAGLATVMGHEVAHAIARHGNERMSQGLITQLGGAALQVALAQKPQQTQQLFYTAYGVGTQVGVMLPFSRTHESEADRLGTVFMAMAGYNPEEAIPFWERMSSQGGGASPPEFLSTHPSPATRIKNLRKYINEAKSYYNPSARRN